MRHGGIYAYDVEFQYAGQSQVISVQADRGADAVERAEQRLPEDWPLDGAKLVRVDVTGLAGQEN